MKLAHIYILLDPVSGEIRYVGWTVTALDKRLKAHLRDRERNHRTNWFRALSHLGQRPLIQKLQSMDAGCVRDAERYWIKFFKNVGCPLTNTTAGGEGWLGGKHSAESREKIAAAGRNRKQSTSTRQKISSANQGRRRSEETKDKIRLANTGKKFSLSAREKLRVSHLGKKHSEDTLSKMRESHRGKIISTQTRSKISAALKGKTLSADTRARIARANLGKRLAGERLAKQRALTILHNQSAKQRLAVSKATKGRVLSEATRQKISKSKRGRPGRVWTDAERQRMSALKRALVLSDETREKLREAGRRRWLRPCGETAETSDQTGAGRKP